MSKQPLLEGINGGDPQLQKSPIELGRDELVAWERAQPENYLTADINLQRSLEFHWGREKYASHLPQLLAFGGLAASTIEAAVREADQDHNLPRLKALDPWGQRQDEVVYHPDHHQAGRLIFGSGLVKALDSPGNNLLALTLFYLSAQNGEAGHNCAVACTAGLVKVLQAVASPELAQRFLPRLLDANYESLFQGAQFLTEVQGGSDVGANRTTATLLSEGGQTWLLNGEKWFCSNLTADLALVTARVPSQGEGTRGLGLFLVPRRLEDGRLNGVFVLRLKDKLGTRSLATGEVALRDALAYQIGPTESGFRNVMTHVINTSRLYNAVASCGAARRATHTAASYALFRRAFGRPIIHFPLVQDQLATMKATSAAILAGTVQIINLVDEIELRGSNSQADGFLRLAINLNKYRTSVLAREVVVQAIELLGGNGAIETFSVLPRLLRDNIVYENWEGTHNVLLSQAQRDMRRLGIHKPFIKATEQLLATAPEQTREQGSRLLNALEVELGEILAMDELTAAIYFRPLMDRLMDLYYAACLAAEGAWELAEKKDRAKTRLADFFLQRKAAGLGPKDIPYYDDLVSRLSG